jgi:two-component system response regulator FlrC
MSSGDGTTTVTQAGSLVAGVATHGLALVWRFPRVHEPPVALQWEGEAERVLGRDAGCSVQLDGHDVSRRHAALRRTENGAGTMIVDLGSRNGVQLNGRPISAAHLGPGDVLRLGGWVGVVTATAGELTEIAPGFWGGAALQAALAPLRQAAASDLPIVIEGETGTGKEVAAGALHRWSGRAGPFVAVNCAALPEALAEGELFGYRRGAFTGADRASPGFFRSAQGGTLLLDEVSDLPLALQAKLLRVLEQREVQPLGETRPVPIDVRVVVAGQQRLLESVRAGRFRADLLARLDGLTARLPPLRQRREDVLPLFSRLLESLGRGQAPAFESDVAERLCLHDWPFNVRELVLLVRRLLTLHGTETTLRAHHLPERIGEPASPAPAGSASPAPAPAGRAPAGPAEPIQLPALIAALRSSGGNVARAAAMLGISRQRAYRLMEGQAVDLDAIRGTEDKPR